jgi:hypothetical protein
MSGPNAARSLPPGDRDDAPIPPVGPDIGVTAGRIPSKAAPDLDADIVRLAQAIDEAQLAIAELQMARSQGNVLTAKTAAWRLSDALFLVDMRAIAGRIKRAVLAQRADRARAA